MDIVLLVKQGRHKSQVRDGRYLNGADNYIFSFIRMAPKDDPKLLVYVAVQQPDIDGYAKGSIPVSMIFNPVMKNSLQYLNIQPSKSNKAQSNKLSDFTGQVGRGNCTKELKGTRDLKRWLLVREQRWQTIARAGYNCFRRGEGNHSDRWRNSLPLI